MKRVPKKHTDEGFLKGFERYAISGIISESGSYDELQRKLKEHDNERYLGFLFNEQKFLNVIFLIQWVIPEIIGNAYQSGHVKNEEALYQLAVQNTARYWNIKKEDAEKRLTAETVGSRSAIYTPHAMLYIAGFGLGNLINILRQHIEDPHLEIEIIIPLLDCINATRNYLVHIPLSGRIDLQKEITDNMGTALRARELLDIAHHKQSQELRGRKGLR